MNDAIQQPSLWLWATSECLDALMKKKSLHTSSLNGSVIARQRSQKDEIPVGHWGCFCWKLTEVSVGLLSPHLQYIASMESRKGLITSCQWKCYRDRARTLPNLSALPLFPFKWWKSEGRSLTVHCCRCQLSLLFFPFLASVSMFTLNLSPNHPLLARHQQHFACQRASFSQLT